MNDKFDVIHKSGCGKVAFWTHEDPRDGLRPLKWMGIVRQVTDKETGEPVFNEDGRPMLKEPAPHMLAKCAHCKQIVPNGDIFG